MAERRAAIDIGSNSIKLLILEMTAAGGYEVLFDDSRVTRLGRGMAAGQGLHPQSVSDSLACLGAYAGIIAEYQARLIAVAATAAIREAHDAVDFLHGVRQATGISEVRVIDGAEEARLSRGVALGELPPGTRDVLFFDVGGGSTEITWCREGEVLAECSLKLGARRCAEQVVAVHPISATMHERLVSMVRNPVYEAPDPVAIGANVLVAGLGGTATALLWLIRGLRGEPQGDPHLARVSLSEIDGLLPVLRSKTMTEMRRLPNLDPARADVIYAGAVIIAEILRHYGADRFLLLDRGLRFGLLLK